MNSQLAIPRESLSPIHLVPTHLPASSAPIAQASIPRSAVIVDDDESVQLSLEMILRECAGFTCVGKYSDAEAALTEIPSHSPGVVLMDIGLSGMSGIECARRLHRSIPSLSIVMVTGLVDEESMIQAREAGACGYVIKPFSIPQCLAALHLASQRSATQPVTNHWAERWNRLTDREQSIVRLIAHGLRNKEIARFLKTLLQPR
jgi:DNA-binding NarL/FixJ family response regulator